MLEELAIDYERTATRFGKDTETAAFLKLNPNGKIPVLEDNGLVLVESLAINVYLARTYGHELWPDDALDQARTISWMAWALAELEGPHDAANRSQSIIDAGRLRRSLDVLRQTLANQPYLLGTNFSVADLNTACVLMRPQYQKVVRIDKSLQHWFRRCSTRLALARAMQVKQT